LRIKRYMASQFSPLSDEELVQKTQQDIDAFGEIIDRYEQKLFRYIARISHFSQEETEELLQEIFVKAWQNLKDFDGTQKFSSWVYRIAHNHTISEYRKQTSRGSDKRIEWDDELLGNLPDNIDLPRNTNNTLNKTEIGHILDSLPEKFKTPLILRFLEEKSYEEISDILRVPLGTAATLVSRAKKEFANNAKEKNISFF
jgi:RNA polymerase sigma-70 factor (ECF subfamily)